MSNFEYNFDYGDVNLEYAMGDINKAGDNIQNHISKIKRYEIRGYEHASSFEEMHNKMRNMVHSYNNAVESFAHFYQESCREYKGKRKIIEKNLPHHIGSMLERDGDPPETFKNMVKINTNLFGEIVAYDRRVVENGNKKVAILQDYYKDIETFLREVEELKTQGKDEEAEKCEAKVKFIGGFSNSRWIGNLKERHPELLDLDDIE